jgi:glycosyltransferase involved in cell wall biosynthesis
VKKLNLENYIIFLGKKNNPYIWMKNSKAFILSSKYEGLPTVLIEALILDVPSISSNCLTGPVEILENGKYGELFNIGNLKELEEKILITLNKREKIKTRDYIERKFGIGFKILENLIDYRR